MSRRQQHADRAIYRLPRGLALTIIAWVALTASASALFSANVAESQQFTTAVLQAPTNPATAPGTCTSNQSDEIVVTWTRSTSTWATGYEVLRSTDATGPFTLRATVSGQATERYTDSGLPFLTTYHYRVRATKLEWRSAQTASATQLTRTSQCV